VEKYLYRYQHLDIHGQWSTKFYAVFTDWQGIARRIPLATKLQAARNKLGELMRKNDAEFDFDSRKRQKEEESRRQEEAKRKGLTLGEYADHYFKVLPPSFDKRASTIEREERLWAKLTSHFGPMPLVDIKLTAISAYRVKRETEVSFVTCNRELGFVRFLLNRALEDGVLEATPRIRLKSERDRSHTRPVTSEEYAAILAHMQRSQQRLVIAWYESSMRRNEALKLTWGHVDFKNALIRLPANSVKEKYPRRTPITWELMEVLLELREEQKRIPNVGNFVFTRPGGRPIKSIRKAFELALESAVRAKQIVLEDENGKRITPHSLRASCITRWTALGIPRDIVMACSGHKPNGVHDGYINFSDQQLTEAFRELMLPPSQRRRPAAVKVAEAL